MLIVPVAWSSRPWALPFLTLNAPSEATNKANGKRHKTSIDWIQQMVCLVRRWLRGWSSPEKVDVRRLRGHCIFA